MRSSIFAPLLAVAAYALPQDSPACSTTTEQVIVPTQTETFYTTAVTTIQATTAKDLGTFTDITTLSSTRTIHTLTSTQTACLGSDTVTVDPTTTVYTTSKSSPSPTSAPAGPSGYKKRALGLSPRQDSSCVVTETSTTTYGQTYVFAQGSGLSTYTDYTAFTQATVSVTKTGGRAYTIATETSTASQQCGPTVHATSPTSTATISQDARCAPTTLVSKAGGNANGNPDFGIEYIGTITGTTFNTNTSDPSSCCQLCVEAGDCAASAWDIRTGVCRLSFTAAYDTGDVACGNQGIIAYYDAGPNSPLQPGTGLFVGDMCGTVSYFSAKPDDGS